MRADVLKKVKLIVSRELNFISTMQLIRYFKKYGIEVVKIFVKDYYKLAIEMPEDFYESILYHVNNDKSLFFYIIFMNRNIFSLISYLKYDNEPVELFDGELTALQYYQTPRKSINKLIEILKTIPVINHNLLNETLADEIQWKLKRMPTYSEEEYILLAHKLYLSIGLDNALELLGGQYGSTDYEKVHYLFFYIDVKMIHTEEEHQCYLNFLFGNKKSMDNNMRQALNGMFKSLFLNFDYFYSGFSNFLAKLCTKMNKSKIDILLSERFLSHDVTNPSITGDIFEDTLSSYYNRYDLLDTPKEEVHKKNIELYNEFLRNKYKSSIPMSDLEYEEYYCEAIKLSDPRNLVLGYRAGNCFRFNGDASILFRNFLKSSHMRLVSVSTKEYKDCAMMLVMRNGNVLIGQGIEISKWVSTELNKKKLYEACRFILKKMMDYMNANGDSVVATIIGSSNSNVSNYNQQVLPFLVNPILENSSNYYNGIYNYQCLLDLNEGNTVSDIKLYMPPVLYFDERDPILRRKKNDYSNMNCYREIEKRLIALRFYRFKQTHDFGFYQTLTSHTELYTCCNTDWYITLFNDGYIDSFIYSTDERAIAEYESELATLKEKNNPKSILNRWQKKTS